LGRPLRATSPGGVAVLAEPHQPSFDGSGPDRLSPHRRPSMSATHEESTRLGFTPIRLTWTPSVVSSRAPRLERPMPQGACAPLPSSPGNGRASGQAGGSLEFPITGLLARSPQPPGCFAQSVGFQGRLTPSPATGSAIRGGQGVFHLEEHLHAGEPSPETRAKTVTDRRVDLYPQVVPSLWIRGPRLSFIPRHTVL